MTFAVDWAFKNKNNSNNNNKEEKKTVTYLLN